MDSCLYQVQSETSTASSRIRTWLTDSISRVDNHNAKNIVIWAQSAKHISVISPEHLLQVKTCIVESVFGPLRHERSYWFILAQSAWIAEYTDCIFAEG